MRTRAAVALEAGKPLEIMEVNLDGPKAGEVLVEIKATGICHTDEFTRSGADPEGLFPSILGHEGAGIVLEVGEGVTTLKPGDHVIPLYTPECRECYSCRSGKTNLCTAIRGTQGKGLMPDGTTRFSMLDGTPIYHYMGCSTFANHTVLPEIALAKVRDDAPFDKICYIGCGVTTGIGAVINTAGVEIGSTAAVFGLGGIGLNVIQGLRMAGADMIIGVDLNDSKEEMARKFGMTHFINPSKVDSVTAEIVKLTQRGDDAIGGVDYSFDATGNVQIMREALECSHRGWGVSVIIGVAPAGAEISTRPFQLVTGRVWKGTAFGGAKGRSDVPKFVDWYMSGKIEIDPMITHKLTLDQINEGFELMHEGKSIRAVVEFLSLMADTKLVIRPAGAADHNALWAMLEPVFRAGDTYAVDPAIDRAAALQFWCGGTHAAYVAEQDGTALGQLLPVPQPTRRRRTCVQLRFRDRASGGRAKAWHGRCWTMPWRAPRPKAFARCNSTSWWKPTPAPLRHGNAPGSTSWAACPARFFAPHRGLRGRFGHVSGGVRGRCPRRGCAATPPGYFCKDERADHGTRRNTASGGVDRRRQFLAQMGRGDFRRNRQLGRSQRAADLWRFLAQPDVGMARQAAQPCAGAASSARQYRRQEFVRHRAGDRRDGPAAFGAV